MRLHQLLILAITVSMAGCASEAGVAPPRPEVMASMPPALIASAQDAEAVMADAIADAADEVPVVPGFQPAANTVPLVEAFGVGEADPDPNNEAYQAGLAVLERLLQEHDPCASGWTVKIFGTADPVGSTAFNLDLSQQRAESVARDLHHMGYPESCLIAIGIGETDVRSVRIRFSPPTSSGPGGPEESL